MRAQFVNELIKKSELSRFVLIFNCIIDNLNFFCWGRFAPKRGGGILRHNKSRFYLVITACHVLLGGKCLPQKNNKL
jgi:hypothetical protein